MPKPHDRHDTFAKHKEATDKDSIRPGLDWVSSLTVVGDTLFFVGSESPSGAELWKSDGTESGTVLVKDLWPGESSSDPSSLTNVNGTLFFSARDGTAGRELWKSDGSELGTVLVRDINPGRDDSYATALANVGGRLVFHACEPRSGCEVWQSDGTAEGTQPLADIIPGSSSSNPSDFTVARSLIYFSADTPHDGRELWAIPTSALEPAAPAPSDDGGCASTPAGRGGSAGWWLLAVALVIARKCRAWLEKRRQPAMTDSKWWSRPRFPTGPADCARELQRRSPQHANRQAAPRLEER